jgi:hypothetical protein
MHGNSGKYRVTFVVPDRWSSDREEQTRARVKSGATSARISKATLQGLRTLAQRVAELHPGGRYYRGDSLSLDELLYLLSSGAVQVHRPSKGAKK